MPAAAVTPAPIAYIKVVAVKKLVVGFLVGATGPLRKECALASSPAILGKSLSGIKLSEWGFPSFTVRKLECSTQAYALNILAWNNEIGPWFLFCWFAGQGND